MSIASRITKQKAIKLAFLAVLLTLTLYFMNRTNINTYFVFKNGLLLATPIAFVALGETISERAGVINVGVEGITLTAALGGALTAYFTSNAIMGILGGIIVGGGLGLLHAFWCIEMEANQIVSGIAINIIAIGLSYVIPHSVWGWRGVSEPVPAINEWTLTLLMLAGVVIIQIVLFKTLWGLRLRTAGEKPEAVDTAGESVHKIRYTAVVLNGILCGLAGVFLLSYNERFVDGMVGGRGFIGIAAMVVGGYVPIWAFGSAYLFGFVFALQFSLQQYIPSQFAQMLPYVVTVIVMAGFLGKVWPPKALGEHYERE